MNQLEKHALLERPSGNPDGFERVVHMPRASTLPALKSPLHHLMLQKVTDGYKVPTTDLNFCTLSVDIGTADLGWCVLEKKRAALNVRRTGTLKGVGHDIRQCQDAASRILIATHPHRIQAVLIEMPSDRYYGRSNSATLCKQFQQAIRLAQGFHLEYYVARESPLVDFVDSAQWQMNDNVHLKDARKAQIFRETFPAWQGETNNHERDAALMGHWWLSVLLLNRKPLWVYGY